jgi:glutaminase
VRQSLVALGGGRFVDLDSALEWCETQLLRDGGIGGAVAEELVPLSGQDLLRDLPADVIAQIESRTVTRVFTAGTVVFDEGDEADGLYFVSAGEVVADVRVRRQRGRRRLSSVAAGSAFGELALVDGRPRSTRIVAVEPTMCHVLSPEAFSSLQAEAPEQCAALTLAIARSLSQRLRASTAEVAALEAL